ncbi:MAG TPA: hypothetical protein VMU39_08115 [Solirubrobacteraceae bacterium]|nr:hypothetical protein [Solirubrobacteraceae bacterium]
MSPRVKPKADQYKRLPSGLPSREEYERTNKTAWGTGMRYAFEPDAPEGCANSWFKDKLLVAEADRRLQASADDPRLRHAPGARRDAPGVLEPPLELAQARLAKFGREAAAFAREAFTITAAGSNIIPTAAMPPVLAELFSTAAHSRARLAELLGTQPLPPNCGTVLQVVRASSGAVVAVQSGGEANSLSAVDPVYAASSSPISYAGTQIPVSRQVVDRAGVPGPGSGAGAGSLDRTLSQEIGAACGEELERQLIAGSASGGETRGLLSVSGVTSVTYTDSTPSVPELISKIGACAASTATADGGPVDSILLHPRRLYWILSQSVSGDDPRRLLDTFQNVVVSTGVPTLLGASTSEDRIILFRKDALRLFAEVEVTAHADGSASGTLSVNYRGVVKCALITRSPSAIGVISGTGLANPTFA